MPKKTYKILRFDGGINNDADPRDIGDNQFSELQNVAVDEMGKIIVQGDIQTTYKSVSGDITGQGRGLFACTTDHTGLLDGTVATPGQTYYLVENGDQVTGVGSTDESGNIACLMNEASMYYVEGALRIAEADLTSADAHDTPIWRGYIPASTYGPAGTGADTAIPTHWHDGNAEIAGAFPTFSFGNIVYAQNAFVINELDNTSDTNPAYSLDDGPATLANHTDGTTNLAANSGMEWGVALEFNEGVNGTGSWMPQDSVRYKFYITTMYDNHTQESLPQLMMLWPSTNLHAGDAYHDTVVQSEMAFTNDNDHEVDASNPAGENVAVHFRPVFKVNDGGSTYNFGASTIGATSSGNPRITGVKIYWASSQDGFTSLWQIVDCKFDEGIKLIGVEGSGGTSGYSPMVELDSTKNFTTISGAFSADNSHLWTNPPRYLQYDVLNAHSPTDTIKVDAYKTAVVANRRVYLGNIKQDGEVHGDRMLKSPVNQFDKFPSINNIDVAIHDGDDIVALVEYADRILQFKKNTCYIINVSGNSEYLESEHKFKGITNPGAACRTDYGVAWVNQNGCYMYNGQQVTDLLEDKGMRKINQSNWASFIGTTNYQRIGFNPFKRQLIVKAGTNVPHAYIFDMVTKSWVFHGTMVADANTGSNFINDPVDGSLMIFDQGGSTIDKWANTPVGDATPTIVIATKDIDFGEPAIRKKVYKVRISYKGDASAVTVHFGTNGLSPASTFNSDSTPLIAAGTTDWQHAELAPTTSSDTNNIYSFRLLFGGSAATDFEINDISFIYRIKGIK